MHAIAVVPGTTTVRLVERPEPAIAAPDEVKVRVLQVGVCGTDREEAAGGRARAPDGQKELILGHEMLGRVEAVGQAVTRIAAGDYAVLTVRRGCGRCRPCTMNRSDMCRTGDFTERGIWGLDGYQAEYVVEKEQYAVRVPPDLSSTGVLTEPLSVAEKAIDEAVRLQRARLPEAPAAPDWLSGCRCLVAGLGPIGLLAAMVLRLREAEVRGLDLVDARSARPRWLEGIGGHYVDSRQVPPDRAAAALAPMDLIFEATGVPGLAFNLLDALAPGGVYVLTGIPGGSRPLQIPGADLIRQLVLDNQLVVGSVNAATQHFQMAVDDLARAHRRWGELPARLITHRHRYTDFGAALGRPSADEIKAVVEWTT